MIAARWVLPLELITIQAHLKTDDDGWIISRRRRKTPWSTALNAVSNVGNQPSVPANGSPAGEPPRRPSGRQGHSSHVAQAAAGALSSDISRRNPQDDYALLQVSI